MYICLFIYPFTQIHFRGQFWREQSPVGLLAEHFWPPASNIRVCLKMYQAPHKKPIVYHHFPHFFRPKKIVVHPCPSSFLESIRCGMRIDTPTFLWLYSFPHWLHGCWRASEASGVWWRLPWFPCSGRSWRSRAQDLVTLGRLERLG